MRDDDELRLIQIMQVLGETRNVRVVERRLDLVEETERRRLQTLNRKQQRDRRQRLLATRQLHHVLQLLSGRLGDDRNRGRQHIRIRGIELQTALTAPEENLEGLIKLHLDTLEVLVELPAHALVELLDDLAERLRGLREVEVLIIQELVTLADLLILLDRVDIDRTERLQLILQLRHERTHLRGILILLGIALLRFLEGEPVLVEHVARELVDLFVELLLLILYTHRLLLHIEQSLRDLILAAEEGLPLGDELLLLLRDPRRLRLGLCRHVVCIGNQILELGDAIRLLREHLVAVLLRILHLALLGREGLELAVQAVQGLRHEVGTGRQGRVLDVDLGRNRHRLRVLIELQLLDLLVMRLHGRLRERTTVLTLAQLRTQLRSLLLTLEHLRLDLLELTLPAHQIRAVSEGTTRDRTARIQLLALERHDAKALTVLALDLQCVVNVVDHEHTAQQELCEADVLFV